MEKNKIEIEVNTNIIKPEIKTNGYKWEIGCRNCLRESYDFENQMYICHKYEICKKSGVFKTEEELNNNFCHERFI